MQVNKKLSVIMHTYYRYDCLKTVLKLLTKQTFKPFEVIISDQTPINDRPGNFYEQFSSLPLKIINLEKPSHAPAQNIGARVSSGDILLFLDDDVEFGTDFLEQHVKVMEEEKVDVVLGVVYNKNKNKIVSHKRNVKKLDPISLFLKSPHSPWNGMALNTQGLNTSIKRNIFINSGGFDEKIPRMADIELGYRLFRNGAKIFHSKKPYVYHKRWTSGGTRMTQYNIPYIRLVSKFYLYKKHFPGWSTYQFLLHEIIGAILFCEPVSGYFKKGNLKNPFLPFIRILQIIKAIVESNKLLRNNTSS